MRKQVLVYRNPVPRNSYYSLLFLGNPTYFPQNPALPKFPSKLGIPMNRNFVRNNKSLIIPRNLASSNFSVHSQKARNYPTTGKKLGGFLFLFSYEFTSRSQSQVPFSRQRTIEQIQGEQEGRPLSLGGCEQSGFRAR